jgi:uncharacterized protein
VGAIVGELGPDGIGTAVVRTALAENRVEVPGFGVLPCAGLYAEVLVGGTVRIGDAVVVR